MSRGWSSALLGGDRGPSSTGATGRRLRLQDYLQAPLFHPWWVLVPFVLTVATATAAAYLLQKRYRASCLVLIKASQVPDKIIANVSEELDARRHQTIRQEILSRTRLDKVNEELHPYPDAPTITAATEAMQGAIAVSFKGSDAFTVEFTHRDPHVAQNVTNRVASLFIEEFRRERQSQFEGAADFLDAELQEARHQLDAKEEALRRFKEGNMGRLPEQMQAILSTQQRLQLELQGVEQNLAAAQARLERLTSRSASDATAVAPATGLTERESLERELARLRQRYTDEHPDVRALVARLRSLDAAPAPAATGEDRSAISSQSGRAQAEVDALLERRRNLQEQIAALQARVEQMPRKEQELATLNRDFNQLRDNYQTLLRKKMDAQMAERLQRRWTDDFEILDQARLPERHVFPNRPLFILVGIVAGLGLGLGAALLAETFSPYVISLEDLEATVPAPVLAVLPLVEAEEGAAAARFLVASQTQDADRRLDDPHTE